MFFTKKAKSRKIIKKYKDGKVSQCITIFNLLENAGSKGVHSFELYNIPIRRAPARILDLRKCGFQIRANREKLGNKLGVRYTLLS